MKVEITNLVKLQKLDDVIRALESRLAEIPKEVETLEKEIATEKANLKAAEDSLAVAQKDQRTAEGELSSAEDRLSKYQTQLMSVKSNDEYKAMQRQMEVTKSEIGDVETKILEGLDASEELEGKRATREQELADGQKKVAGMEKELEAEKAKLEAELVTQKDGRKVVLDVIPEAMLGEYQNIAKTRGGIAMAAAVEERCQICMVRIRPQVFHELRMYEKFHHCASCGRILYFLAEEQSAAT